MVTTPTFQATTSKRGALNSAGYTLIEILVVLGIIAASLSIALPRLFKKDANIRPVARHFLVLGKEVRNHARLKNSTMRLAIDMDPAKPKYWVEKSAGIKLIDNNPDKPPEQQPDSKDGKKPTPDWDIYTTLTKEKKDLPSGLYFGSVETINMKQPQTEGIAYIHFFPEGLMEASSVQITDRKNITWTLIFNPLTGQADIVEEARSLKDVSR